jgi:hypothetical protein
MLAVAAAGVTKLVLSGGKMRPLSGAYMSEADVETIRQGHVLLEDRLGDRLTSLMAATETQQFASNGQSQRHKELKEQVRRHPGIVGLSAGPA